MSSVVVHNSPHIALTLSLSRSTYENFKLLKNLATTCRLKWEERKSYRTCSTLVDCRTDLVLMSWLLVRSRHLAKHGDITRVPTSCVRVVTSCYDITRYWSRVLTSCYEKRTSCYDMTWYEAEFWRVYYNISTSIRDNFTTLHDVVYKSLRVWKTSLVWPIKTAHTQLRIGLKTYGVSGFVRKAAATPQHRKLSA